MTDLAPASHSCSPLVVGALLVLRHPLRRAVPGQRCFQDDAQLLGGNGERRDATLDEWKALGVDVVKIARRLARHRARPTTSPANPSDPAAYRADRWQPYDARDPRRPAARHAGLPDARRPRARVGRVERRAPRALPSAASAPLQRAPSSQAVRAGRRHRATRAATDGLPRRRLRRPAARCRKRPTTLVGLERAEPAVSCAAAPPEGTRPPIYRNLLYGGVRRAGASGHGSDKILIGELLPFARGAQDDAARAPARVPARAGLRRQATTAPTGATPRPSAAARTSSRCPAPGIAYHPYTLAGGPKRHAARQDDATINELTRSTKRVDKLRAKRFVAASAMPIWLDRVRLPDRPARPVRRADQAGARRSWASPSGSPTRTRA